MLADVMDTVDMMHVCVFVCVCVWGGEGEEGYDATPLPMWPCLNIASPCGNLFL